MLESNKQQGQELTTLTQYNIVVLLVDDQPIIAEAVRRALQGEEDITLHYCQNPTKAIGQATDLGPTLILQDLVMPELDGLTMVKFFRTNEATADIPIIVLSTKEDPKIKSEAFALGANDYLVKLPDKIELIARIRYHSKAYITQQQRDEAFQALQESQSRLAAANKELQKLSSLDGLTGIANRRRFDEVLRQEWNRSIRHSTSISLIMFDIDYFKRFNDRYGHQNGDDCLRQVANQLKQNAQRGADLIARYGGEEFAVILPETASKGAAAIAEQMRTDIQKLKILHEDSTVSQYVSISLGVASAVPERDSKPKSLIAAADKAMYQAKKNGRNQVVALGFHVE